MQWCGRCGKLRDTRDTVLKCGTQKVTVSHCIICRGFIGSSTIYEGTHKLYKNGTAWVSEPDLRQEDRSRGQRLHSSGNEQPDAVDRDSAGIKPRTLDNERKEGSYTQC